MLVLGRKSMGSTAESGASQLRVRSPRTCFVQCFDVYWDDPSAQPVCQKHTLPEVDQTSCEVVCHRK